MPLEVIYRDRTKDQGAQANLTQGDMNKVMRELMVFVIEVNNRTFPTKKSSIIWTGASNGSGYLSPQRTKELTDRGVETFRILYYDMKWSLSRCLGRLKAICFRRIDNPGTWNIAQEEGQGMYLAEDGENNVPITSNLADTAPIDLSHTEEG